LRNYSTSKKLFLLVLCNAPSNYALGLTKGTIRAGCYIDM